MLFIFDKDNTLIAGFADRPANTREEQVVLPNVVERLAELRAAGHVLTLASNQGGVARGNITHDQAFALMEDADRKVGGVHGWKFCPHGAEGNCNCHKPKPGMLLDLMKLFYSPRVITVFVGNEETDQQAAEAAGVKFVWAADFFGWKT